MTTKAVQSYRNRWKERKPLRTRIHDGDVLIGSFVFLANPSIVEILAEAGLDFFIIDQEHAPKNWETVENMVRAAEVYGLPALVRVHENSPQAILHALEVGAAGVVIPFVEDAEDVRAAVKAARYAPDGARGTCTQTRAARHSAFRSQFVAYAEERNDDTVIIGLIENELAVNNINDILSVKNGLDCLLLGRADLASDLGKPGQSGDPLVVAATDKVLAAINATGGAVSSAMAIYGPGDVARWKERGCSIFMAPSDASLLFDAAKTWHSGVAEAAAK